MFKQVIILDLETTINAPEPHFGAAPAWPDNFAVAFGFQLAGEDDVFLEDSATGLLALLDKYPEAVLVGHNLSFDLMYLFKSNDPLVYKPRQLWDTMKFHHIQTGKADPNPSLVKVAKYWGIPFQKDDEIKERFKLGIGADQIDQGLLYEYLEGDVKVTEQIFMKQLANAVDKGNDYVRYVVEMMTSIKATSEMTMNGLAFDTSSAETERNELEVNLESCEEQVIKNWGECWPCAFNPNSPSQIETLLWGGEAKVSYEQEVLDVNGEAIRYKSGRKLGEVKTKKATRTIQVPGMVTPKSRELFEKRGWDMKSSAQTLQNLVKHDKATAGAFAADILELRNKAKTITTYFKPYLNFAVNGVIHPAYNHCVTQTGRLSSSKPNMQNVTNKDK